MWNKIKDELNTIRDKFVPRSRKAKNQSKRVTKKVTRFRKAKTKAWDGYIKSGRDSKLYQNSKIKLRESVKENRKAKRDYEERLAENIKSDSKSFYSYVNSKWRTKVKVGSLKDTAGNQISKDQETSEVLNNYFSSVFTEEDIVSMPNAKKIFKGNLDLERLNKVEIDENLVRYKLVELNVNKSPGPDEVHPKFL